MSKIPFSHPIFSTKFPDLELKQLKKRCVWTDEQCNAYRWHDGPNCGLIPMSELRECRWEKVRNMIRQGKKWRPGVKFHHRSVNGRVVRNK